jgi:hypothetical protein
VAATLGAAERTGGWTLVLVDAAAVVARQFEVLLLTLQFCSMLAERR